MTLELTTDNETRPGIDLQSPDIRKDPFPTYSMLRDKYPVCQTEPHGIWVISRYDDVRHILGDPIVFSSKANDLAPNSDWLSDECRNPRLIFAQDPPEHGRFHSLVNRAFIARVNDGLAPLMRDTAVALCGNLKSQAVTDFVGQFSYPYIGETVRQMMGLAGKQTLAEMREWVELEEQNTPTRPSDEFIARYEAAVSRQYQYFMEVIEDRRACPKGDLASQLAVAKVDGRYLARNELCSIMGLLVASSFATTIQMLNNAIIQLSAQPSLVATLKSQPELIPDFIEELLRYSPAVHSAFRQSTQDCEIAGVKIPSGSMIMPLLAAANRDKNYFAEPDLFNIHRPNNRAQLAFGHGVHICIGAALARLELRIALEVLLESFSHFSCPPAAELDWINSIFMRCNRDLPVSFT